jgi:hypothetical protein
LIGLSRLEVAPTFFTMENYVGMEELFWQRDYHNYVHEGCRVDLSALLKLHCYTSARLQEICKAKFKVRYQAQNENVRISSLLTTSNRTSFAWLHGKAKSQRLR